MVTPAELRRLEQAATPGPWEMGGPWLVKAPGEPRAIETRESADTGLIAAARNALPALLDIAEAAKAYATHTGPEWDRLQAEAAGQDRWDSWEARRKQLRASLNVALSRLDTEGRHG